MKKIIVENKEMTIDEFLANYPEDIIEKVAKQSAVVRNVLRQKAVVENIKNNDPETTYLRFNDNNDMHDYLVPAFYALKDNKVVKGLSCYSHKINSPKLDALFRSLEENSTLKTLELSLGNQLTGALFEQLNKGLNTNEAITDFKLLANFDQSQESLKKGMKDFAEFLAKNTLKSLSVSFHSIDEDLAQQLISGLKQNTSIKNLSIECNVGENDLMKDVIELLESNKSLLTLNLSNNNLDNAKGIELFKYLKNNGSLYELNLSSNKLNGEINSSIIDCVENYKASPLRILNLKNNEFVGVSAQGLQSILKNINKVSLFEFYSDATYSVADENAYSNIFMINGQKTAKFNEAVNNMSMLSLTKFNLLDFEPHRNSDGYKNIKYKSESDYIISTVLDENQHFSIKEAIYCFLSQKDLPNEIIELIGLSLLGIEIENNE